ncbi:MAG: TauD/TfdA family dioxygenase [Planctomycetota bacterium]
MQRGGTDLEPARIAWEERARARALLREHPLVLVRAPGLAPRDLVSFACTLGDIEPVHRPLFRHEDDPRIMRRGNPRAADGTTIGANAVGHGFHSDMSFRPRPPRLTMLYAVETPRAGGATEFGSLERLHGLLAEASWSDHAVRHETPSTAFRDDPDRASVKPLVAHHPDHGRPFVYASPCYAKEIVGIPADVSADILARIAEACEPPDYAHAWQNGDLLLWDNLGVVHRATPFDPNDHRLLWRMSVHL